METKNPQLEQLIKQSIDSKVRKLQKGDRAAELYYLSSLCDERIIYTTIDIPFLESPGIQEFVEAIVSLGAEKTNADLVASKLVQGCAAVIIGQDCYALRAGLALTKQPLESRIENTIYGPYLSLSEDINTNLNLLRNRYPMPDLAATGVEIGKKSHTQVVMVYDSKLVNPAILQEMEKRLKAIDLDVLNTASQLSQLLNHQKLSMIPSLLLTERPDRLALSLSKGKIGLLVKGSPSALIAPTTLHDFMTAMDDLYQAFWVTAALTVMRYLALFVTLVLPGLYIAVVSYNPEVFRVQLTLSIAGSRAGVPYPSFVEVIIMLFLIEALIESSIRLPKYIGGTATTVGGLILGQAAQQAGLVSSIMIIVTSAVAISNFVIPINSMSFAMRIAKYPIAILATILGIFGIMCGLAALCLYLCDLRSFDQPFLKLTGPFNLQNIGKKLNKTGGEG